MGKWTVLSSRVVHENPWYHVRHDKVIRPDGCPGNYYVAEFAGSVCVLCIRDGKILTVKQYRYATSRDSVELPMGGTKGADPLSAAKAELKEETGYTAKHWEHLGNFQVLNGACNMKMDVFMAGQLEGGTPQREESETDMCAEWIPLDTWRRMIRTGVITDAESIAAWALYREWST